MTAEFYFTIEGKRFLAKKYYPNMPLPPDETRFEAAGHILSCRGRDNLVTTQGEEVATLSFVGGDHAVPEFTNEQVLAMRDEHWVTDPA